MQITFTVLPTSFAITKLPAGTPVPPSVYTSSWYSITKTSDELSVVCPSENADTNTTIDDGWSMFKFHGPFDFNQTGVVSGVTTVMANGKIGVFVVSTYDTDYMLVNTTNLEKARQLLTRAGHTVILG